MPRPRKYTKMMAKGEGIPAIRIAFPGKDQVDYLALHRIAKEDFQGMRGATLVRLILKEWVTLYRSHAPKGAAGVQQMTMLMFAGNKSRGKVAK